MLKGMLQAQKKLDMAMLKKGHVDYSIENCRTAYRVELAELLNELQYFKYWKLVKKVDERKVKEEYADCLHFALSLENSSNDWYITEEETAEEILIMLLEDKKISIDQSLNNVFEDCFKCDLDTVLMDTLKLGYKLGFDIKTIELEYYKKNTINWDRVKGGY